MSEQSTHRCTTWDDDVCAHSQVMVHLVFGDFVTRTWQSAGQARLALRIAQPLEGKDDDAPHRQVIIPGTELHVGCPDARSPKQVPGFSTCRVYAVADTNHRVAAEALKDWGNECLSPSMQLRHRVVKVSANRSRRGTRLYHDDRPTAVKGMGIYFGSFGVIAQPHLSQHDS